MSKHTARPQKHLLSGVAADLNPDTGSAFLLLTADGHEIGFPVEELAVVIRTLREAASRVEAQRRRFGSP